MTGADPATDEATRECELCGRPLRTEQSRRRGRGRTCDEKVNPRRGRDHSPRQPSARRAVPGPDQPDLLDVLDEVTPCAPAE
jgi:hypothetical protein